MYSPEINGRSDAQILSVGEKSEKIFDIPSDVDVVFPVSLVGTGHIPNIGACIKDQGTQVMGVHCIPGSLKAFPAQAIEIDPLLPVRSCLAVESARGPMVRFDDPIQVHFAIHDFLLNEWVNRVMNDIFWAFFVCDNG
jgi:hypothetical protein